MVKKKTKEKVSITLSKDLIEKLDKERGMVSRSRWIEYKLTGW